MKKFDYQKFKRRSNLKIGAGLAGMVLGGYMLSQSFSDVPSPPIEVTEYNSIQGQLNERPRLMIRDYATLKDLEQRSSDLLKREEELRPVYEAKKKEYDEKIHAHQYSFLVSLFIAFIPLVIGAGTALHYGMQRYDRSREYRYSKKAQINAT